MVFQGNQDGFPETVPGLEAVNAERPDAELWAELEAGTGTGTVAE